MLEPTIRRWLTAITIIAVMMALFLTGVIVMNRNTYPDVTVRLEYWKFYLSMAQFIIGGFLVASLVALIPKGLSEARQSFARRKESLIAFSRAKTGVDYLSLRLCVLTLKEASALVQATHVWKHRAQLYHQELADHLRVRGEEQVSQKQWADLLFAQLASARKTLEEKISSWDATTPDQRLADLRSAQEAAIREWEKEENLKRPD